MGIMIYSLLRVMQDLYHQPYLGVPYLFIVYHSLVGATSMQILTLGFLMCVCVGPELILKQETDSTK